MAGVFEFPKRRPGDSPIIPAEALNAMIDAARQQRSGNPAPDLPERTAADDMATVLIKNKGQDDLPRYSVVMLGEPIFDPTGGDDALAAFKSYPSFQGLVPVGGQCEGWFAVTLEPIAANGIGTACVAGAVPVQLWVGSESDWYADATDGIAYALTTGPTGNAQILWKQPGTGLKWGIVRLQPGPSFVVFEAEIHSTGPQGQPDFDDERYWVREENPLGGITDPNDPDFGTVLYNYQGGYWGPATNLAEYGYTPKTHNLADAENVVRVIVFGRMDLAGNWCYQFRESGATALLDGKNHTDTAAHAPAKGDLIHGTGDEPPKWDGLAAGASYSILSMSAAGLPAWFAKGTDGKVLRMTGGALVWGDPPAVALLNGGQHSDTAAHAPAQGEFIVGSAAGKWDALAAGGSQSLLYNSAPATPAWMGPGTDKQVLTTTVAGGVTTIGWAAPAGPTGYTGVKTVLTGAALDGNTIAITNETWHFVNGVLQTIDTNPPIVLDGTDCSGT